MSPPRRMPRSRREAPRRLCCPPPGSCLLHRPDEIGHQRGARTAFALQRAAPLEPRTALAGLDRFQGQAQAQAIAGGHDVGEADTVETVVEDAPGAADFDALAGEAGHERQGEEAVRDEALERRLRPYAGRVGVDPVPLAGDFGEGEDHRLGDLDPEARLQFLADEGQELPGLFDAQHGTSGTRMFTSASSLREAPSGTVISGCSLQDVHSAPPGREWRATPSRW